MPQALTLQNPTVHCDACGHEFPGKPEDWHKRPCPKCSHPNVVDDEDMAEFRLVSGIAGLINGLCDWVKRDQDRCATNTEEHP